MRLNIRHETRYHYEDGAPWAAIRVRLFPVGCATQTVKSWVVRINGAPLDATLVDAFGVPECVWRSSQRLQEASIIAEGVVETVDRAGIIGLTNEAAAPLVFLRDTELTHASEGIVALAAEARSADGPLSSLHNLCALVHGQMDYRPQLTDSATSAADAFALKRGVCQDFAHVFIAAARQLDIPARYVAGYVHDADLHEDAHVGHGWAEAFISGLGWVGFDPSRKICVTDEYVRMSWGFDAFGAAPLRGVAAFGGAIDMDVAVAVARTQGQCQTQQQ